MANLDWTKDWSTADDGTILTGSHLADIQSDLAAVLKAISDGNIDTAAAIQEAKIAFHITTGHYHDGVGSRLIASTTIAPTHGRYGGGVHRAAAGTVTVDPFHVVIGGTFYNKTTATTLTLATAGDYIFGSEQASAPHFVYVAYDATDGVIVKLSTEAPDLSDTSDNATEIPFRYQKYTYNSTDLYFRCLGQVYNDASSNVEAGRETSFDLTNFAHGRAEDPAANMVISTIWTPRHVRIWVPADNTPATTELYQCFEALANFETDYSLNFEHGTTAASEHRMLADTTAGAVPTLTAQAAGTAGSFTITTVASGRDIYWAAWGDMA